MLALIFTKTAGLLSVKPAGPIGNISARKLRRKRVSQASAVELWSNNHGGNNPSLSVPVVSLRNRSDHCYEL